MEETTMYEIWVKLTKESPERRPWGSFGVSIVDFKQENAGLEAVEYYLEQQVRNALLVIFVWIII